MKNPFRFSMKQTGKVTTIVIGEFWLAAVAFVIIYTAMVA